MPKTKEHLVGENSILPMTKMELDAKKKKFQIHNPNTTIKKRKQKWYTNIPHEQRYINAVEGMKKCNATRQNSIDKYLGSCVL
jgi:hypothetical protein